MKKLKEVVDKQRDEIRAKDRELTLKNEDIEAVRPHSQYLVWMSSFLSFFYSVVNLITWLKLSQLHVHVYK